MSTTEAPFVVSHNYCAIRANTVDELAIKLREFVASPEVPNLIAEFRSKVSMQGVTQSVTHTAPVTVEQAVQNLATAGVTGTVTTTGPAIEIREDKWGNKYTKGNPDAGSCNHGTRMVKDWEDRSGTLRKAYVCVNDSPFGNFKDGKCDLVWPARR